MENTGRAAGTTEDLYHPIPQRRYAFIPAADTVDATRPTQSALMNGLQRPTSAPAELAIADMPVPQRASSPLSRVTNPMVRDFHFRRGIAADDPRLHPLLPRPHFTPGARKPVATVPRPVN